MSRIQTTFEQLQAKGRKALIPYVTAGFPFADITPALMHGMVEAGADIIELGVPFSDPMADGPVIQKAGEKALALGIGLESGPAMAGSFGQASRRTHMVMGRTVTIASRLVHMTADLSHPILVGEGLGAFAGGEGGNGRAHGAAFLGAHYIEGFFGVDPGAAGQVPVRPGHVLHEGRRHQIATAGIDRPIHASAEPNARFRLVWMRLARAARIAANPSGSSTIVAMMTPTRAAGAPMAATAHSTQGDTDLASKTTAARLSSNMPQLIRVIPLLGGGRWLS